ncbi:MAG TPA: FtsX-like permease family protein [Anaerolineales bacterium]|nr:FtsX-like permease family protein [Anaerolineales bacterium]HRF48762.1 FtsX-like permease family protein [Anaerolineales bacterium]
MSLYLRQAWRNIWRHKRRTLIVVFAIGSSMSLMMMYDGLVGGFENAIYGNAIRVLGGNIQVHAEGYDAQAASNPILPLPDDVAIVNAAQSQPHVLAAARRINTGGMVTNREGAFAVSIVGIEPEKEAAVNLIAQNVVAGRFLTSEDGDLALIGQGLAAEMNLAIGDRFTLTGQASHSQLRQRTLTVVGIYDVGMPDIEKRSVYLSLKEAQDLYGLTGQSTEVAISLEEIGQEPGVIQGLQPGFTNVEISSWEASFPDLKYALDRKGAVMDVFSVIILGIAGIGILNMLLMAVFERTREIGLLGALGMRPGQIMWLFLLEGAMMGLVGVTFGVALGVGLNFIMSQVGFDYSAFTSMTAYTALINERVYSTLGLEKIGMRVVTVLVIALLASIWPAREAAHSEPALALHHV